MRQPNPDIVRYIRLHRDRYTREAIRRQLMDAGFDPVEVDQAWSSVEPEDEGGARNPVLQPAFIAYVILLYGLALFCSFLGLNLRADLGEDVSVDRWVVMTALIIAIPASIWLVWLATRSRAVVTGTASAVLIALLIPFVFVVIISGLCLYLA